MQFLQHHILCQHLEDPQVSAYPWIPNDHHDVTNGKKLLDLLTAQAQSVDFNGTELKGVSAQFQIPHGN